VQRIVFGQLSPLQGAVLRARDGRLSVRMPAAARPRSLRIATGAHLVPSAQSAEDSGDGCGPRPGGAAGAKAAGGGDAGSVEEQLLETLRSVVVGHVMRRVCKEAAAGAGDISAAEVSAGKDAVSTCHVVVRSVAHHRATDAAAGGADGGGGGGGGAKGGRDEQKPGGGRVEVVVRGSEGGHGGEDEGRVLALAARRLLRCDQRHSHTPKQPQGTLLVAPLQVSVHSSQFTRLRLLISFYSSQFVRLSLLVV
jgi:hypothetical protein